MLAFEKSCVVSSNRMFSVDRVSRQGDKFLGRLRLDHGTLANLRRDRIGLLFEKFLCLDTIVGRLIHLAERNDFGRIIIVYATKESGSCIYQLLSEMGSIARAKKNPTSWTVGSLTFTSIEGLPSIQKYGDATGESANVSMVILIDTTCMVHKARSMYLWNGNCHDRPQILTNAIADWATVGIEPLFVLMTCRTAVSLNTEKIARTYNRETWWFCDGPTMRIAS